MDESSEDRYGRLAALVELIKTDRRYKVKEKVHRSKAPLLRVRVDVDVFGPSSPADIEERLPAPTDLSFRRWGDLVTLSEPDADPTAMRDPFVAITFYPKVPLWESRSGWTESFSRDGDPVVTPGTVERVIAPGPGQRDARTSADYWPRSIAPIEDGIAKLDAGRDPKKSATPQQYLLGVEWAWTHRADAMVRHYSAGTSLETMAGLVAPMLDAWERWLDEAPGIHTPNHAAWAYSSDLNISLPGSVARTLSFAALLRPDLVGRAIGLLDRMGGDVTLDRIFGGADAGAPTPKPYHRLEAVLDADTVARPGALKKYLSGWYGAHRRAAWWGTADSTRLSTTYPGYWAVEAAAAAVLLGIDDTGITSEYYPRELADHGRRLRDG